MTSVQVTPRLRFHRAEDVTTTIDASAEMTYSALYYGGPSGTPVPGNGCAYPNGPFATSLPGPTDAKTLLAASGFQVRPSDLIPTMSVGLSPVTGTAFSGAQTTPPVKQPFDLPDVSGNRFTVKATGESGMMWTLLEEGGYNINSPSPTAFITLKKPTITKTQIDTVVVSSTSECPPLFSNGPTGTNVPCGCAYGSHCT